MCGGGSACHEKLPVQYICNTGRDRKSQMRVDKDSEQIKIDDIQGSGDEKKKQNGCKEQVSQKPEFKFLLRLTRLSRIYTIRAANLHTTDITSATCNLNCAQEGSIPAVQALNTTNLTHVQKNT